MLGWIWQTQEIWVRRFEEMLLLLLTSSNRSFWQKWDNWGCYGLSSNWFFNHISFKKYKGHSINKGNFFEKSKIFFFQNFFHKCKICMEWKCTDSPVKKTFWAQQSVKKLMLTVYWDMKGPISNDFFEKTMLPFVNSWDKIYLIYWMTLVHLKNLFFYGGN